jgi:hypothetical protein
MLAHRALDPFCEPRLDRIRHGIEQLIELTRLFRGKWGEDEVCKIDQIGRHGSDPDAKAGVILALEATLYTLQSIVASSGPGAAQPKRSERNGDVVDQDEEVVRRIEVRKRTERR